MLSFVRPIRSVAVLGAGTMGAQIAGHFANAGVRALLLDLTNDLARDGLARARRLKPDPFFTAGTAGTIETGGFDRDLPKLATADWIIEAIVEQSDVKRALLEKVDAVRRPGLIVTSNTSGLSIEALARGRTDDFRRHWLGTHFFNPPRYLHLLEVIPASETESAVVQDVTRFADVHLGKGVVIAKDTPSFIANRIGLFGLVQALRELASGDFTIEEIDAITGPAIGRPRSATFRTVDIAGLDVLGHVVRDLIERLPDAPSRAKFELPPFVNGLLERGWIGEKASRGFYERRKAGGPESGSAEILTLDPSTFSYRANRAPQLPALESIRAIEDVAIRLNTLFAAHDRVGAFLRRTLGATLLYAAEVAPEIAHSIDDVDRAMRWGFGWEMGPFEMWDAIGVQNVLRAVGPAESIPPLVDGLRRANRERFRDKPFSITGQDLLTLKSARARQQVIRRNPGASLMDLGDGVLAVDLHSKMNVIGPDTIQMLNHGVREACANFRALVIGTEAQNFSAGANLTLLLLEAQQGNWDEIDEMVRAFQGMTRMLRFADVPVVSCPGGLTLGGGCEIVLHTAHVQAAAESYVGLVEAGVGLIPAGGGTKEMLRRAVGDLPRGADTLPFVQRVFETIGFAKVSTSADDARALGYLRGSDLTTMNRARAIADAKAVALEKAREGYRLPAPCTSIPVGGENLAAALKLGVHQAWRGGHLSDHDALIGRTLADVLAGGSLPHATLVSEAYLLDLEREAFLKLCGERKTLERIQYTLKTGKALRN